MLKDPLLLDAERKRECKLESSIFYDANIDMPDTASRVCLEFMILQVRVVLVGPNLAVNCLDVFRATRNFAHFCIAQHLFVLKILIGYKKL